MEAVEEGGENYDWAKLPYSPPAGSSPLLFWHILPIYITYLMHLLQC